MITTIALGTGVLTLAACGSSTSSGSDKPTPTKAQAAASTTVPAPSTTTAPPAGPIFTQAGSGSATTANFRVPDNWDLAWTYDCAKFPGGQGYFGVTIYDNDEGQQLDFDNQGVNQSGPSGQGVEHYHSGGNQKFLKVNALCDWTITVTKG